MIGFYNPTSLQFRYAFLQLLVHVIDIDGSNTLLAHCCRLASRRDMTKLQKLAWVISLWNKKKLYPQKETGRSRELESTFIHHVLIPSVLFASQQ